MEEGLHSRGVYWGKAARVYHSLGAKFTFDNHGNEWGSHGDGTRTHEI